MTGRFMDSLINMLLPKSCAVCRKSLKDNAIDGLICQDCWGRIKNNTPPFCTRCGRHIDKTSGVKICPRCRRNDLNFDRAFSPCLYDGVLKELIHKFKYQNKDYLGKSLSRLLIDFIKEYELPVNFIDAVVPIPLHERKMREREFNQSEVLGEAIAREFNIELLKDGLFRVRDTVSQTDLADKERWTNIKDCFAVDMRIQNKIKGRNLLLVDDILTTGATCSEAASTLKKTGAGVVFVLTLAR